MLRPFIAAMALVFCAVAVPSHAHPLVPGLRTELRENPAVKRKTKAPQSVGRSDHLSIARRYVGKNPTGWKRLWCARFIGYVLERAGRRGTGSNLAKSYARYGKAVSKGAVKPGDIAVLNRKGGGHVGIVAQPPKGGKVVLVSGNSGGAGPGRRVVTERAYPVGRVIAWRRPA